MLFRKAETCEAEAIRALYQAVIGTPFCTWDESYPGETEIAGDLSAGTLYVLEEDHQTIGTISIIPETSWLISAAGQGAVASGGLRSQRENRSADQ